MKMPNRRTFIGAVIVTSIAGWFSRLFGATRHVPAIPYEGWKVSNWLYFDINQFPDGPVMAILYRELGMMIKPNGIPGLGIENIAVLGVCSHLSNPLLKLDPKPFSGPVTIFTNDEAKQWSESQLALAKQSRVCSHS